MAIRVENEIGRLRRVLIHRPGYEIDWMVPSLMERLLFDDILDGEVARVEHEAFDRVLQDAGVETLDPQTLLGEVLESEEPLQQALELLRFKGLDEDLCQELGELPAKELAKVLVVGVRSELGTDQERLRSFYRLAPVPNYFFQRDPQVVFGHRVLISSMATAAREREPLIAELIFRHHPALAGTEDLFNLREANAIGKVPWLEGGDVLVPSPEVLLVGVSERTNRRGVEALAHYLQESDTTFRHLLVVELPARRSYMHLDTVFTFIDHGLCLGFPPVISSRGSEAADVYHVDLESRQLSYTLQPGVLRALAGVGLEMEMIPCGGSDPLNQQREQWTDGANAFAIAPGVLVLYQRNRCTMEELDRRGFRIIEEDEVLSGKARVLDGGPTVVSLVGYELSRARGGPRCMTMPLERDPLT